MSTNALENLDPKTDQKLRSVHNTIDKLKDCKKHIKDYVSASQKMHAAAQAFAQASKIWGDALQKLAGHHSDDIGEALTRIVGRETAVVEAMDGVCRSLTVELATPLDSGIDNGARELDTFEKEMKENRARLGTELKKLEATTKKAGGKGGDQSVLIQAMKDFNAKREEIDRFKSDQLHTVFLIERRRFGEILNSTTKVISAQLEYARTVLAMEADMSSHSQLLTTLESLSEEQINALSTASQKAFTSLNTSESANVTLTGSTNAALSRGPPTQSYGSPRPAHMNSPGGGGGGGPPGSMPPPPNFAPGPPGSMPPPPNFAPGPPGGMPPPPNFSPPSFSPGPPSFEPPPPMPSGGPPKMGPPKLGAPPPMPGGSPSSPRPSLPPPMPSGSPGTMRSNSKAPPPMPGKGPGGPPPMPGRAPGPPPSMGGPPPPMGGPPPPMGGPPPPMSGGGGGPPPPPPGGAPPPPKGGKPPSSSSGGKKKGGGGGGGDERGALLSSINGFKGGLKKTVTNDRSAPILKEDKKPGMGRGGPPMF